MYHGNFMLEMARERIAGYHAEAEKRRWRKQARRATEAPSWRARAARRFFDMAFAFDAEESWRAVWEKMSAVERPRRWPFGKKKYVG